MEYYTVMYGIGMLHRETPPFLFPSSPFFISFQFIIFSTIQYHFTDLQPISVLMEPSNNNNDDDAVDAAFDNGAAEIVNEEDHGDDEEDDEEVVLDPALIDSIYQIVTA